MSKLSEYRPAPIIHPDIYNRMKYGNKDICDDLASSMTMVGKNNNKQYKIKSKRCICVIC